MTGLDCIAALKALGEETRLRILCLLFKEPLSVNEISDRLRASQYNISKHLRIMREAGLLVNRKTGQATSLYRGRQSQVARGGKQQYPRSWLPHVPAGQAAKVTC